LGSDSPVTPLDPWGGVRAAVHHRTPAQRLPPLTAFDAHTRGGWLAAGTPGRGVLEPGADATYAVWRTDDVDRGSDGASPPLPPLDAGADASVCERTAVHGVTVFVQAR